jgi:redox-sensitive bicupin YhaK (pirin superfamily)
MDRTPTIRLRRSDERGFEDFGWTDNSMTFSFAGYHDPRWMRFGPLRVMVENHIQPRSGFPPHPHRDVEIVTYVSAGTLTHRDSFGHSAGISAGEMQRISAGARGMVHAEENLHDVIEHNYQMWLIPDRPGTGFDYAQLKYTDEERRGQLRLYVSPDGRDGSMTINTDARIYSGLFDAGEKIPYEMETGRGAWVQVVHGRVDVAGTTLGEGDGMGITGADRLDFEFTAPTELLLFDVRMDVPLLWE